MLQKGRSFIDSAKKIYGFTFFLSLILCSLLIAAETMRDKNFCSVFWGSVIFLSIIIICFTICVWKEKDTEYEIEKLKLEKIDKLIEVLQKDGNFDTVEFSDDKKQTKTITHKNQILVNQMKTIANIILES